MSLFVCDADSVWGRLTFGKKRETGHTVSGSVLAEKERTAVHMRESDSCGQKVTGLLETKLDERPELVARLCEGSAAAFAEYFELIPNVEVANITVRQVDR